jgi:hypothetical protein
MIHAEEAKALCIAPGDRFETLRGSRHGQDGGALPFGHAVADKGMARVLGGRSHLTAHRRGAGPFRQTV